MAKSYLAGIILALAYYISKNTSPYLFCIGLILITLSNAKLFTANIFKTARNPSLRDYIFTLGNNSLGCATIVLLHHFRGNMIVSGFLCNLLICLAVGICEKLDSNMEKMQVIAVCIIGFIACGYHHSVVDIIKLLDSGTNNGIISVIIGNILGGLFIERVWRNATK